VDINQHLRVIRRWHKVIIASLLLGAIAATLFLVKFSTADGFSAEWRRPEKWQSTSRLFVTQRGFPWGRTTLPGDAGGPNAAAKQDPKVAAEAAKQATDATSYADPNRLSLLAIIYSFISQSNTIGQNGHPLPPGGEVSAQELANNNTGALPLFQLNTIAQTKAAADGLNRDRIEALTSYLANQQNVNEVPTGQRVQVTVLNRPEATRVSSHGAMLGAAMVFLALSAGLAASYMLESLRLSRQRRDEEVVAVDAGGEVYDYPPRAAAGDGAQPQRYYR
jgi:hypothetical protein